MDLLYLSRADVEGLGLTMREILDAVDQGFAAKGRGQTEMPPKPGIHTRPDCFIHAMPAYVQEPEVAGLKWVSGYPPNPAKGLPYITGLLVLNDPETGVPLAVMDCAWITAMRTGASAGISAKYLARADSAAAAMVGCGVQARPSLAALVETLPALVEVRCYDLLPGGRGRVRHGDGRGVPGAALHRVRQRLGGRRAGGRGGHGDPDRHGPGARAGRRRSQGGRPRRLARLRLGVDERGHARLRQVLRRRRAAAAGHARARRVLRRHPGGDPRRPGRARGGAQAGPRARRASASSR